MQEPGPDWSAVRLAEKRRAAELSLVLQSLGLPHRMRHDRGGTLLEVPTGLAEQARSELERYESENVAWPPRVERFRPLRVSLVGPAVYAALLSALHYLAYSDLGGRLLEAGRVEGVAVRAGELWRTVTALTLHVDVSHLAGNLFLGAALGHLCAQVIGAGPAWLGILAAGALGNLVNVYIHEPTHRSVGASTAVFGALGLLAALQWHAWGARRGGWLLRLAPLLVAGAMLGFLGTGGERTDVGAHVTGMAAGAWLGFVFRKRSAGPPRRRLQVVAVAATLASLAGAWALALGSTP